MSSENPLSNSLPDQKPIQNIPTAEVLGADVHNGLLSEDQAQPHEETPGQGPGKTGDYVEDHEEATAGAEDQSNLGSNVGM